VAIVAKVYQIGGPVVTVTLDTSFPARLLYDQTVSSVAVKIYRVDFYDPSQDLLRAILPCAANSTMKFDSGGAWLQLTLQLTSLVGDPGNGGQQSTLLCDTNGNLTFQNGLWLTSSVVVTPGDVGGPEHAVAYLDTLNQLSAPSGNQTTINGLSTDIAQFGSDWNQFLFGSQQIAFRVRSFWTDGAHYPVLTLERLIASTDAYGLRSLPGVFSINIALKAPGAQTATVLSVQRPADAWLTNTSPGIGTPATDWVIDINGFQEGTINDFWQRAVVDRYVGALESVSDNLPVSLLPGFSDISDGSWRLNIPVSSTGATQPVSFPSLRLLGSLGTQPAATGLVTMTCSAFRTHDNSGLSFSAALTDDDLESPAPWMSFQSSGDFASIAANQSVRIGSMDLAIDSAPPSGSTKISCQVTFEALSSALWIPKIQLNGQLSLVDILPGGQDEPDDPQAAIAADAGDSTDFAREQPLTFPISAQSTVSQFFLNWSESSVPGQNQQLELTINAVNPGSTASINVLVIDRDPFMVALAQLPGLASSASAAFATVAEWSNNFPEGAGWRISAGAGSFQLLFPPQGVGEAMVKDNSGATSAAPTAFKLPPPLAATLQIDAEAQLYSEPPWNLRRILGYPGERAPGALVQQLQFEMLYGLAASVTAPNLHFSELFSRLGGFAGPLIDSSTNGLALNVNRGFTLSQQTQFALQNYDWAQIYQQLISRLGVFELWNQESTFDLLLTDGLQYNLRPSADMRYPTGQQPPTSIAPVPTANALAGGVSWGFDSTNIYETLWKTPISSSASLTNPRFTALGGYGKQRAAFSNDNIIIETEHAMGMLESLSITLIGRIGNLWHHAKHIVVYERTVQPARQFYTEQPAFTGRPILRKVKEYVEITQRSRAYPESGGGAVACGFVEGAEFKSIRINVDSAWGADVGTGWMVPLWRRDASPSDVYPRPHILLQLAVDPATGNDSLMCEVLDPEKLCFYSDPSQPSSNTDSWPPVQFIDYSNTPRPAPGGTDYTVAPGLGRFSYSLSSDASQINVVSQRAANAISSALTNVTFMRAQNLPGASPVVLYAGQLHDWMNNTIDQLVAVAKSGGTVTEVNQRLTQLNATLVTPYRQAVQAIQAAPLPNICATLAASAANGLDRAAAPLEVVWQSLASDLQSALDAVAGQAQNTPVNSPDTLAQGLISELDNAIISAQTALGPLLSDLSAVSNVVTALNNAPGVLAGQLNNLKSQITPTSLGAAGSAFRISCQNYAAHCGSDIDAVLANAEQALDTASYLFGSRLAASSAVDIQQLRDDLQALQTAFDGAMATLQQQLGSAAASSIYTAIGTVTTILDVTAAPLKTVHDEMAALQGVLATAMSSANTFSAQLATLEQSVRTAIQAVPSPYNPGDYQTAIDRLLSKPLAAFDTLLAQTKSVVSQQVSATCGQVLGTVASAAQGVLNLLGQNLTNYLNNVTGPLDDALEQLRTDYTTQLDGVVQQALDAAAAAGQTVVTGALNTGLSLLRAFGAPPAVPTLDFSLDDVENPGIGYFFSDAANQVALSSGLMSSVLQASTAIGQLSQLGLSMPTTALLDRLIPPDLTQFDLSDILPNIAGLDLSSLFDGVYMPAAAQDNIVISHHIDPQTLRAALDVTMNFPLIGTATLFSIGPVTVSLDGCVFQSDVHVAGGVGQTLSRTSSGSITADWHVQIAGTEIITFVNTTLSFDEAGHLNFSISPERVQLASVLQFLAEFVQSLDLGGGFSLNLLPAGVQCILDLPFPDMSFGVFGITNLTLGSVFELDVSSGFVLKVGANLGRQESPFTLTIFILGGAGWFEATVQYNISDGSLSADVSIGILAAASLSISLGPISGGLYVYFGITAEFHTSGGLTLAILLMMQGRVSVLGIIDADITLLLEAEYTSGGGLIGRGQVSISIKICWCFTLSVSANVQYQFGNAAAPAMQQSRSMAASAALAATSTNTPDVYATAAAQRINYLT
jgi:hypothetical protein